MEKNIPKSSGNTKQTSKLNSIGNCNWQSGAQWDCDRTDGQGIRCENYVARYTVYAQICQNQSHRHKTSVAFTKTVDWLDHETRIRAPHIQFEIWFVCIQSIIYLSVYIFFAFSGFDSLRWLNIKRRSGRAWMKGGKRACDRCMFIVCVENRKIEQLYGRWKSTVGQHRQQPRTLLARVPTYLL